MSSLVNWLKSIYAIGGWKQSLFRILEVTSFMYALILQKLTLALMLEYSNLYFCYPWAPIIVEGRIQSAIIVENDRTCHWKNVFGLQLIGSFQSRVECEYPDFTCTVDWNLKCISFLVYFDEKWELAYSLYDLEGQGWEGDPHGFVHWMMLVSWRSWICSN